VSGDYVLMSDPGGGKTSKDVHNLLINSLFAAMAA
jgi:hypothetical protein